MREPESYTHSFMLPGRLEATFNLFSDPRWLNALTPGWFDLRPIGSIPTPLRAGTLVPYRLRWRGLPLRWTSLITEWEPPHRLTYEQHRGPYRTFVHEHVFQATAGGTHVTDRVTFRSPAPRWFDRLLVRRDLGRIFRHRSDAAQGLFADRAVPPALRLPCLDQPDVL